jgi:hypothetical protein
VLGVAQWPPLMSTRRPPHRRAFRRCPARRSSASSSRLSTVAGLVPVNGGHVEPSRHRACRSSSSSSAAEPSRRHATPRAKRRQDWLTPIDGGLAEEPSPRQATFSARRRRLGSHPLTAVRRSPPRRNRSSSSSLSAGQSLHRDEPRP